MKELKYLQETRENLQIVINILDVRIKEVDALQPKNISRDKLAYTINDFSNGNRAPKDI
jgi:hypothetical protein